MKRFLLKKDNCHGVFERKYYVRCRGMFTKRFELVGKVHAFLVRIIFCRRYTTFKSLFQDLRIEG